MGSCERYSRLLPIHFLRSVNHLNWNHAVSFYIVQCAVGAKEVLVFSTHLIRFDSMCFPSLCQILSAFLESPFPFFLKPCMGYPLQPFWEHLAVWLYCAHIKTHCHNMIKSGFVPNPGNAAFKQEVACCIWKLICLNLLSGICILETNICLAKCSTFESNVVASYLTSWY